MKYSIYPSIPETINAFREALAGRETIIVTGLCSVKYEGRASSVLGEGERILVVKQDGATLIHRPTGSKPVNWQPANTVIKAREKQNEFTVEISRRHPREKVTISFKEVKTFFAQRMVDAAEFYMYASERDMQRAIFLRPRLIEEGLKRLKVEKEHPEGYIDVLAEDSQGRVVVIEIKRKSANRNDVLQMHKYVSEYRKTNPSVRGILVAPSASKKAQILIHQLDLEFKALSPQECVKALKLGVSTGNPERSSPDGSENRHVINGKRDRSREE